MLSELPSLKRVRHLMDVAFGRQQHLDLARRQRVSAPCRQRAGRRIAHEVLRHLRAAQDADQPPHLMIVHRRRGAAAPTRGSMTQKRSKGSHHSRFCGVAVRRTLGHRSAASRRASPVRPAASRRPRRSPPRPCPARRRPPATSCPATKRRRRAPFILASACRPGCTAKLRRRRSSEMASLTCRRARRCRRRLAALPSLGTILGHPQDRCAYRAGGSSNCPVIAFLPIRDLRRNLVDRSVRRCRRRS